VIILFVAGRRSGPSCLDQNRTPPGWEEWYHYEGLSAEGARFMGRSNPPLYQ